jgi:hypothetical protein
VIDSIFKASTERRSDMFSFANASEATILKAVAVPVGTFPNANSAMHEN